MKINTNPQLQGSTLLVTLMTATIIGVTLASYLSMVSNQNRSTMRSLSWNSAVPIVEAGLEEGLTQIYFNGITNLTANDWSLGADGFYHKSRDLGGGNSYDVLIKPLWAGILDQAVIESTAHVPAPLAPSSTIGMILGSLLPGTTTQSSPPETKRRVQIVAQRQRPTDAGGIVGTDGVNLSGNNLMTDSFDSADGFKSTNGKYDSTKAGDQGDVVTNSGLINSVNVGNADVKGHVNTGPNGTVAIGSSGAVGSKTWVEAGNNGIQTGWVSDDANVDIPIVVAPYNSGQTPQKGNYVVTNLNGTVSTYDYKLTPGINWVIGTLNGKVYVAPGAVTLLVKDSVKLSGNDQIYIDHGGSLEIFMKGASADFGGQGISNPDVNAFSFQYYGLPSNTYVSFGGNFAYTGVVYAPSADFSLGGGGSDTTDFVGACITKTVKLNGHIHAHRDLNISRWFPIGPYKVRSWNELDPNG